MKDNDIIQEFSLVICKTNKNMAFASLVQEPEYLEWLENIHALTLQFISNTNVSMIILQNFLEFWSSFSYYAEKNDSNQYAKLKNMMLTIAINYLNVQSEIAATNFNLEEIFENDSNLHEYMRFLPALSQPK